MFVTLQNANKPRKLCFRARSVSEFSLVDAQDKVVGVASLVMEITERNQAEESLRESEEEYRNLVESTNFPSLQILYRSFMSPPFMRLEAILIVFDQRLKTNPSQARIIERYSRR